MFLFLSFSFSTGIDRLAPVTIHRILRCNVQVVLFDSTLFLNRLQTKPQLKWPLITSLWCIWLCGLTEWATCVLLFRCYRQLVSEPTCFNTGERAEDLAAHIIIPHYCGDMHRLEDNMLSVRTSLIPLWVQNGVNRVNNIALWTRFLNTWPFSNAISLPGHCVLHYLDVLPGDVQRQVHHKLTHPPSASRCGSKASGLSGGEAACAGIVLLHLSDNPY